MREKDVISVSTRYAIDFAWNHARHLGKQAAAKLEIIGEANIKYCELAVRVGIRIAFGTDLGNINGPNLHQNWTKSQLSFLSDTESTLLRLRRYIEKVMGLLASPSAYHASVVDCDQRLSQWSISFISSSPHVTRNQNRKSRRKRRMHWLGKIMSLKRNVN